ncbi:MAG: hypothetical protein GXO65_06015 [Euryarchaeota archaeon]|nr:hypothetical protein [Euryarchaeota archaeon]
MTREAQKPTVVRGGRLYVPDGGNLSLPRLFLKLRPMTEKELVRRVWMLEAVSVVLGVIVAL